MMRKFWAGALAALVIAGLSGCGKQQEAAPAPSAEPAKKSYVEYTPAKPSQARSGTVEVREFFWYACPHCFKLKAPLEGWLASEAVRVTHIRQAAPLTPAWMPMSRAYHAMLNAGGFDQELHNALFIAWHVAHKNINAPEDTFKVVEAIKGVAYRDKFEAAYKSTEVDDQIRAEIETAKLYGVDGTPSVVVAGKYLVNGSLAGGEDKMVGVIDMLVKRELTEGKK